MILKTEQKVLQALKSVKTQLQSYPTPIAGCDVQFNYLLAERQRLTERIRQMRGVTQSISPSPESPDR